MVDLTWKESFEVLAVIARKEKEKKLGLITYYGIYVEDYRGSDQMPIVKVWASPTVPINNIILEIMTPEEMKDILDDDYTKAQRDYQELREEHHDLKKLATGPDDTRNLEKLRLHIIGAEKKLHGSQKAIQDWHIGMGNV